MVDLEITDQSNVAVATFSAPCLSDVDAISAAGAEIKRFVRDNRIDKLVFDFSRVRFFSSQVLGLLLDVRAELTSRGGRVVISAINPQLHRVFKITNLEQVFQFFEDKQTAVEAINTL